jgi:2-aminoadipate transaminase
MATIQYGQYDVPPAEQLVKFNVGQPSPSILNLKVLQTGLNYVSSITNPSLLQYGDIPGYKQFRENLALFLETEYDATVNPQELFITNGVTHSLTLICSLFLHKGSIIFVEEPTYFLAINIFKELGLKIIPVSIDQDGINLQELESKLKLEFEHNGDNQMTLYTIPTFHNPTSYTMSHEKRLKLAELAKEYNMLILADEVYQMLYFDKKYKPPLPMCYYSDQAISIGSFSKTLAPAMRMGWMQIKNNFILNKFLKCGQYDSSGGSSPITQALIHGIISNGNFGTNIIDIRFFLKDNCKFMANYITEKLSNYVEFIEPEGGYFLWLKVKNEIKVEDLMKYSDKFQIMLAPGWRFSANGECQNYVRLSFSYYDQKGIKLGIERLLKLFLFVEKECNIIKVAILGYKGKLGSKIVSLLDKQEDMQFIEGIDRDFKIEKIDEYSVIIDVSRPDGTQKLLENLIRQKKPIPVIIGTTGELPNDLIEEYSKYAKIQVISNFSLGIPQVLKLLDNFDFNNWDISMLEEHHINKIDKPSGTAITLQKKIGKDIPIESIRDGDIIGTHTLTFDRNDEQIVITHIAKNRDLFANGALNYCRNII